MRLAKSFPERFLPALLALPLLLGIAAFGAFWLYQKNAGTLQEQTKGSAPFLRPAPSFALEDQDGKKHSLGDYRGSLIFLHFWASWCSPCLDEIPHWKALGIRLKDQPVKFVAISLDQKWSDALKVFSTEGDARVLISLIDPEAKVAELYGSYQYPETYLISPELKIITKWVGPQDWNDPQMKTLIERAARGDLNKGSGPGPGPRPGDPH